MNETDELIYERFLSEKNESDLLILIERHRESLMLFLNGFVGNIGDAEELMMDTFAEVAAGPTLFSGRSSFRTWLFSIGKNLALMWLRKAKRFALLPVNSRDDDSGEAQTDTPAKDRTGSPEFEILKSERNRQLYEAMGHLNEEYRRILVLMYFEGMSYDEVSHVMRKNKKQIYNLAERGKTALKAELKKMGFAYEDY